VLAHIEPLRKDKQIGSSLQARVVLSPAPTDLEFLKRYEKHLPMLFIVSEVELESGSARSGAAPEEGKPGIAIQTAKGVKCLRCWRYVPAVSKDPAWEGLCDRCQDALAETVNG
jgi:isoleucyl-tRNA synthetase